MLSEDVPLGGHISSSIELLNNESTSDSYATLANSQFTHENQMVDIQQQYQHLLHQNHMLQEHLQKLEQQNQILQQQLQHSLSGATNNEGAAAEYVPRAPVERTQTPEYQHHAEDTSGRNSSEQQSTSAHQQITKKRGSTKVSDYSDAKRRMLNNSATKDLTLTNKYSILETIEEPNDNVINLEPQNENVKIPPICIRNAGNITLLTKDLTQLIGNGFTLKTTGDSVKIFLKNVTEYRTVRKYCDENNVPYYTYCIQSEKNLSVVIKKCTPNIH